LKRLVVDCSVVVALALQEPESSRLGDVDALIAEAPMRRRCGARKW